MLKKIKLKTLFVAISLVSICLILSSCSINDKVITQAAMSEETFSSPSRTSIKSSNDTLAEVINPPEKIIDLKSEKVISSWEEYEASDMPLLAAIPEKDIYLYAVKSTEEAQVVLYVGESKHYYNWSYMTPRFTLPQMQVGDYDYDGKEELSIILYIGSGTGVSIEDLHIIEISEEKILSGKQADNENLEFFKDYIFNDYGSQINKAISFKTFLKAGKFMGKITTDTKTYTVNLEEFQSEDYGKIRDDIYFESIVRFNSEKNKLTAEFGVGIFCENSASANYIGTLNADVDYKSEKFELKNLCFNENIDNKNSYKSE